MRRESEVDDIEEEVAVNETPIPPKSPVSSIANDDNEVEVNQEELQRRAAYDDFIDRLRSYLDTLQDQFRRSAGIHVQGEPGCMYPAGRLKLVLAKCLEVTSIAGVSNMDSNSPEPLIDAEEAFEEARERAQALGAIGSDYGQECYYGAEYEESWPENKVAEYIASQDWSSVEAWVDHVLDPTSQADVDSVEIDEWDAEEVDVNDSISVIDYEDYRRDIDRNRRICARFEDPCPEVRWLGQPDARVLERRSSCWM